MKKRWIATLVGCALAGMAVFVYRKTCKEIDEIDYNIRTD